jgi:RHS repeat-associated protein
MPIDIATGAVDLTRDDFSIPGRVPLIWRRHFRSRLIGTHGLLGTGWTTTLFPSLRRREREWHFTSDDGELHVFRDPDETVVRGNRLRLLGAFLELCREGNNWIVTEWDPDSDDIKRFVYSANASPGGVGFCLTSIENVAGDGLWLEWDGQARLQRVSQRVEDRSVVFTYSDQSLIDSAILVTKTGDRVELVSYTYDSLGRLITAVDARGLANRYEYDGQSRLTREIVREGAVYSYKYDHSGRCAYFSGLDRYNEKRLKFLDGTNKTWVTNSRGETSIFERNAAGQITTITDPDGYQRRSEFDENNRLAAQIDPSGAITRYTYDADGNRNSVTDPLGNTYEFFFNAHHQAVRLIDPLGKKWTRSYDADHRLVSIENPMGARWTIEYDEAGNAVVINDPLGHQRRQSFYDGLPYEMTDWMGHVTTFRWDGLGRLIERLGPVGERTGFNYDAVGNVVDAYLPDGGQLHATYDGAGNLTSVTNAKGETTRMRYGPCRRLLERTDALGRTVRYEWGTEPNHLDAIVNESGDRHTYVRNRRGHVIREIFFDGREQSYECDAAGRRVSFTNGNGETIRFRRDLTGRLVQQVSAEDFATSFDYDAAGRLIAAATPDSLVKCRYDDAGRLVEEHQDEQWVRTEYNAAGEVVRIRTSLGHEVKSDLDPNGRLRALQTAGGHTIEFERDPRGLEVGRVTNGRLRLRQQFDSMGRLVTQQVQLARDEEPEPRRAALSSHRSLPSRKFHYDADSLLIGIEDKQWGPTNYVYDPVERLISVSRGQGPNERFEYDGTDNLTRVRQSGSALRDETFAYSQGGRLVVDGEGHRDYDAAGRLVRRTRQRNGISAVWQYSWDSQGQLRAIRLPNGTQWEYKYDAFGRRVKKNGPDGTRRFLWNRDVVIHEFEDGGRATAWITQIGGFIPLAKIQRDAVYTAFVDHLGTPRELIDDDGRIVWMGCHDAFGHTTPLAADVVCDLRFQGQWCDPESGLHYNRFRYYDPSSGRFISPDPTEVAGGLNEYAYGPNPVSWVDPLGLTSKPGCPESEDGDAPQYFIEDGVRRAVAARERGSPTVPAIIHEPGKPPVTADIPLSQLNSPKPIVPRDQRMVNTLMQPGPPPPISVSPMPGPVPTVPLADVKLVKARP